MVKIIAEEIKIFSQYVYNISGIHLEDGKAYLFETRFGDLLKEYGCSSYSELYYKARGDQSKTIERKIIDAITTKETMFFRDTRPFDLLMHKIIPELIDARKEKSSGLFPIPIRIWSTACATGQEVYSIAIVLKELFPALSKYNIKILGTDISWEAIETASRGEYNNFEVQRGLMPDKLQKYFTLKGNKWKINDQIRAMVSFRQMNLMLPFLNMGKFDVVFCRNVAIYFNIEDRKKLFAKLAGVLEKDGYLVIGATEYLTGICPQFEPKRHLKTIFYQLKE